MAVTVRAILALKVSVWYSAKHVRMIGAPGLDLEDFGRHCYQHRWYSESNCWASVQVGRKHFQWTIHWNQRFPFDYTILWQIRPVPVNTPNSANLRRRATFRCHSMAKVMLAEFLGPGLRHRCTCAFAMKFCSEIFCRMSYNRMAELRSKGASGEWKLISFQFRNRVGLRECVYAPNRRFAVENTCLQARER